MSKCEEQVMKYSLYFNWLIQFVNSVFLCLFFLCFVFLPRHILTDAHNLPLFPLLIKNYIEKEHVMVSVTTFSY